MTDISDSADPAREGGVSQTSDSEIHFRGKLEADNGLTFSVKVEMEGNSQGRGSDANGDDIDESQLTVSGSFGQIVLGSEDHPAALMHYGNQDVGVGYCGDSGWSGVTGCSRNTAPGPGNERVDRRRRRAEDRLLHAPHQRRAARRGLYPGPYQGRQRWRPERQ